MKENIYKHMKKTLNYEAKEFMLTKKFKKSLHIVKECASSLQVGILNT